MSALAAFPQPLYAKDPDGAQLIILGILDDEDGSRLMYIGMYNEASNENHGRPYCFDPSTVIFEHFYWPEIEPSDSITDFVHPQEPALKVW